MYRPALLKVDGKFLDSDELMTIYSNVDPTDAGSSIVLCMPHTEFRQVRNWRQFVLQLHPRVVMLRKFVLASAKTR